MLGHAPRRPTVALVAVVIATLAAALLASAPPAEARPPDDGFYVQKPLQDARRQIASLTADGQHGDADLIREMVAVPSAVWLEQGTPAEVERQTKQVVARAAAKRQTPVFVAYNIPFRDCAQYSAGGATSVAEYTAWIDGIVAGLARVDEAIVILEPDGLGIIPWYTSIDGNLEWCRPAEADPDTAAAERFAMLDYAVDALGAVEGVAVYLDGTHTNWLAVGDLTDRLLQAGVLDAQGFFLNASNYQWTDLQVRYGEWVSQCIDLTVNSWWQAAWCGSQYYPATSSDPSTWDLTDAAYDQAYADTGIPREPTTTFVVDTSRNGLGPWTPTVAYPDPQDWCNPPDRGLGLRPTTATGSPLADAFLWIKTPGESDGECTRGLTDDGGVDPEWGQVDPAAGAWFPEQALELARLASPPL